MSSFKTSKVLTISGAHFIHDVYSSFLAPILPLLIEKLSLSYSMVGALWIIQRISSLFNPFIGLIADKVKVRYFIIVSPAITAIVMSFLGMAPGFFILAILLFVMGLSATLFHVPAPVIIKRFSGDKSGQGMSFYMLGGELARTAGPLTILGAVSYWGLVGTWKLIPFGVAASIILFFMLHKIDVSKEMKKPEEVSGVKNVLKELKPLFITLAGITLFSSAMRSSLTSLLPTYLNFEGGNSLWYGGISLAILQLAGAAGTMLAGPLSDKIGRKPVMIYTSILSPILMAAFILGPEYTKIPILILLGITLFSLNPIILAIVQDKKSSRPAFVNGIYMTINFFTAAVSVSIITAIADFIGLKYTYLVAAALGLGTIPFIIRLYKLDK